jgi:hypothetical protein
VEQEDSATVVDALADLFAEQRAPLVMKCDSGPPLRALPTKHFLVDQDVFALCSPRYCARYNGTHERASPTLKELTAHIADQADQADYWKCEDLLAERLRASRLSRPWGPAGSRSKGCWNTREIMTLDKRKNMWRDLGSGIAAHRHQREIDPAAALTHYS